MKKVYNESHQKNTVGLGSWSHCIPDEGATKPECTDKALEGAEFFRAMVDFITEDKKGRERTLRLSTLTIRFMCLMYHYMPEYFGNVSQSQLANRLGISKSAFNTQMNSYFKEFKGLYRG